LEGRILTINNEYDIIREVAAQEENERVLKYLRSEYYKIRKNPENLEISAVLSRLIKEVKRKSNG
jgi:hypothetical protein